MKFCDSKLVIGLQMYTEEDYYNTCCFNCALTSNEHARSTKKCPRVAVDGEDLSVLRLFTTKFFEYFQNKEDKKWNLLV